MTTQANIGLIWASTGGVTDPGDSKYTTGWISEIPTFQNFNFVLQNHSKNFLALAERSFLEWDPTVNYIVGARIVRNETFYTCVTANFGQDPEEDNTYSYWMFGIGFGDTNGMVAKEGVYISNVNPRTSNNWDGNDIKISNANAMISLCTTDNSSNLALGNVNGDLVVVPTGTTSVPDGRSLVGNYKVFHENNPPDQTQVANTIPANPLDGILYGRRDANWVQVSTTTIGEFPPQPVKGTGTFWYNLQDGELYVDVDDGDTSQWVPVSVRNNSLLGASGSFTSSDGKDITVVDGIITLIT